MTAIINSKSSLINSNAGRHFDTDTGLYYYRARYHNPYLGRFLQTDPIGYADGMNTRIQGVTCFGTPTSSRWPRSEAKSGVIAMNCCTGPYIRDRK